jgi:hypothetical protein
VTSSPPGPRGVVLAAGAAFALAMVVLVVTQAGAVLLVFPAMALTAAAGLVGMIGRPSIARVVALAVGGLGTVALTAFAGLQLVVSGTGSTSRADGEVAAALAIAGAVLVAAASAYAWRWAGRRASWPAAGRHALLAPAAGTWAAVALGALLGAD